jgi:hypothetical protein
MSITILTLAIGKDYCKSLEQAFESKRAYATKHGYTYIEAGEEWWDRNRPIAWSKVPFIIAQLEKLPDGAIVWQSDADVLITNPDLKKMAHNLYKQFNELTIGARVPNYTLETGIEFNKFLGKAVYLHFYDPSNMNCISEIGAIRKLNDKYGPFVEIVTIYPTPQAPLNATELRNLKALTTNKFALPENHPIWDDLKIKTFPYYILLDEQLNIKSMPALAPSPNGLYETIEKTFYDIKRKKENH